MVDFRNFDDVMRGLRDAGMPPLPPGGDRATLGGMDPWQQSVEKRLDSLDSRAQRLEATTTEIRVDVATLKERMSHLPTKSWMIWAMGTVLTFITGLITFSDKLHALIR